MKILYFLPQSLAITIQRPKRTLCDSLTPLLIYRLRSVSTDNLQSSFLHFRAKALLAIVLVTSFISFSSLAEDILVNRLLAAQCAQCHGPNGAAVDNMESLTDESSKDLFEDLRDMRREDRPENIMDHQALGYTQEQIRRIADYYGFLSGKNEEGDEQKDEDENKDEDEGEDEDEDEDEDDRKDSKRKEISKQKEPN